MNNDELVKIFTEMYEEKKFYEEIWEEHDDYVICGVSEEDCVALMLEAYRMGKEGQC